jgi:hypothetical protein
MKTKDEVTSKAKEVTKSILSQMVLNGRFLVYEKGIIGPTVWDITHKSGWSLRWAECLSSILKAGKIFRVVGTAHYVFKYKKLYYDAQNPEGKKDIACLHSLSGISKSSYIMEIYWNAENYFRELSENDKLNLRKNCKPVKLVQ